MKTVSFKMKLTTIFTLLFASTCIAADSSTTTSNQPSSTSSAPATTHTVQVGNGDHKFRPNTTTAAVGDIIEFQFYPQNHSVVRAEYTYPCIPYELTGEDKTGFFSGFNFVDKILPDPPTWHLRINDTAPVFFYCSAPGSCTTYGMVGVINPNSSVSLDNQQNLALSSSYSLNPGEPFPAESPVPTFSSTPPVPSSSPIASPKHGLSSGAIAGIAIAAIGVVALGAMLFFFVGRSRTLKQEMERKASTITRTSPPSPSPMFQKHSLLPPAYFASPRSEHGAHEFPFPATGGLDRAASHRSVGGTFSINPTTGYYTRTHDGQSTYKHVAPYVTEGRHGGGRFAEALNEGQPAEMDGGAADGMRNKV